MTFGEKLQKLRAREGLSQDRLAELLDVSRQAVSKWERDETMPETEKVVRISDCFHVTTDYLLKDAPEQKMSPPRRREFGEWFQDRGWLLGWIPAAWGLFCMVRLWPLLAFQSGWWMRGQLFLAYHAAYGTVALTGLAAVMLGRRRSGRLRWYHAGALTVIWGGAELLRVAGLAWMERTPPEDVILSAGDFYTRYQSVLVLAAAGIAVGLAVVAQTKSGQKTRIEDTKAPHERKMPPVSALPERCSDEFGGNCHGLLPPVGFVECFAVLF